MSLSPALVLTLMYHRESQAAASERIEGVSWW
ncbi:MAG: hypothetical protein QG608_2521 [Actinomycetota bacterium]|nr:hypothetical protein [Actinomycetota bacterium]